MSEVGYVRTIVCGFFLSAALPLVTGPNGSGERRADALRAAEPVACFILHEVGVGEVHRGPSSSCSLRTSPQSTFKIPHALAALDAGVIQDAGTTLRYDGHPVDFPVWGRDHTLATAMRYSVVWYFQEIARRLGPERERQYLERFNYGNHDSSSGLTTFWLGGSLKISAEEELRFLLDLYGKKLHVAPRAAEQVMQILVQPNGMVVNAQGEHPFGRPWAEDVVLSAKTGAGSTGDGRTVRWLVGHVRRGQRSWVFVSNIVAPGDVPVTAAIEQGERGLAAAGVLR